jgi:hypothetical protein
MLKDSLLEIFERDLNKLKNEIGLYKDDESLWTVSGAISNSGGNLCLHLLGNLNHYVGALLGESGYVRARDREFSSKNVSRAELIKNIEEATKIVTGTLNNLSSEDFQKDYPVEKHEKIVKTEFMLLHLLTHFNYHLGQINYHRRITQNS